MDRIDIHEDLCTELHELYVAKNADYGDSFAKVREEIPNAILVRLSDKLNRLKSLMTKDDDDRKVRDESIDDTLIDIANYALLELVERRNECDYYCDIECEDDEEEEYTGSFSDAFDAFRNAVSAIKSSFCKKSRQNWIDSERLHDEIFSEYVPEINKLKVVHYVMKDGEVIDSDINYYDKDDDIELDVECWKEFKKENKDDNDKED